MTLLSLFELDSLLFAAAAKPPVRQVPPLIPFTPLLEPEEKQGDTVLHKLVCTLLLGVSVPSHK